MVRKISRDPFARSELHSTREYVYNDTCKWCGQVKITPTGRKFLYQYIDSPDSISNRDSKIRGLFCSVDCMRTYHS